MAPFYATTGISTMSKMHPSLLLCKMSQKWDNFDEQKQLEP